MRARSFVAVGFSIAALVACGGATVNDVDAGDSGGDASSNETSAPFACGTTTCNGNEFCVHTCCGGAPLPCVATDDAGACPAGTTEEDAGGGYCPSNSAGPCVPAPCTPPPDYCSTDTSTCAPVGHDCFQACG